MQIYEALISDHRKVSALLERLVHSADADAETRKDLVQQIRDELIPHSRAEEAIFYNSLRTIDGTKGMVLHGYAEHLEAESLLRTLQAMDAVDANWAGIAKKLRDGIEHHVREEETEIIPAAKQVLAPEEAEMMAKAFEQMKPQVREGGFMQNTLDLIANAMPGRFSETLRNFIHGQK